MESKRCTVINQFFNALYCFASICGLITIVTTRDPVVAGSFIFGGMVIYSVSRYIEPLLCKRLPHSHPTASLSNPYHCEYSNLIIHPEAQRTGIQSNLDKDAA